MNCAGWLDPLQQRHPGPGPSVPVYAGEASPEATAAALKGWERPVYMVHEHHSRSHHFDLRLEFDGVLRSWAVPKGLSDEAGVRRLAMQVPDHALSYAPFEGVIPEGAYGAGKVDVWDRGSFRVLERGDGKLVLELKGQRVRGVYELRRTRFKGDARDDGRKWLVTRLADGPDPSLARPGKRPTRPRSPKATTRQS